MNETKTLEDKQADLAAMFEMFNETTERLQSSHDGLQKEVRRLRAELEAKNAELMRKNRLAALGEMAAGIAHEIRNPLGGIQLYASLLERDLQGAEPLPLARKISLGVKNLNRIVEDVLAFTGETVCNPVPCEVADLIDAAQRDLLPQAEAAGIQMIRPVQTDMPRVSGDAGLLERALCNLMLNAVQATQAGGRVAVKIRCNEALSFCYIDVIDSGCGLKEDALDRIFNPFYTDKDAGTGLGLAIVHRIMESHRGGVIARNNDGPGATFTLKIPIHANREEGEEAKL